MGKAFIEIVIPILAVGGKMLPVHCIVELLDTPPGKDGGDAKKREEVEKRKEGYAIVPSTLQLRDLVRVALSKLDYPPERAKNATGVIQVRNWKALPFASITDNQQSSVGQLFGDLLSHITLKISVLSSDASSANCQNQTPEDQIRSSRVGGNANGSFLSLGNLGNSFFLRRGLDLPFGMMARRMKGGEGKGVGRTAHPVQELRIKLLQVLEKRGPTLLVSHGCPFSQVTVAQILQGKYNKPVSIEKIQAFYQWYNIYNGLTDNTLLPPDRVDSSALPRISSKHWRRPRTLFNPRTELPRLLRWYRQNPRPTRAEMEVYLAELNASDFRRNGTPLQYSSIMIWFKNARVKYRHLLRSTAIAQMREDMVYAKNSKDLVIDESMKDSSDEGESDMVVEEKEMEEQEEEGEEEQEEEQEEEEKTELLEASSSKSPVRSSAKSPSRSPGRSPARMLHLKVEPITEGEDSVGNENQVASVATSVAKPTILPSLLHMHARPHLQPVSIVSNGLIVPSRLHNGSHQAETALHVPDLRKIASGFGISLTPELAAAAHAMPIPGFTHHHFLQALDSVHHKESPSIRLDYHNSALSVPKPTPSPLTTPSASQRRTPTPQSYKHQSESPKPEKSPQSNSSQTSTSPATRVPRKRFTIDPTFEVPKLQSWFAIDPRPDRQTIERYVQELNSSEWRRHQPKYNNRVVYVWFKNARAKYSKMQVSSSDRDPDMERRHHELMRMHQEAQMS
ncbi:uncharacterized protein LOC100888466 [Strongylocentrotus purpuratus]|uniref:Uncharacterized protein n=1 Tax=Strongylocentrotus purpuratus TaxID=7668 RepID=A0A7M7STI8_STRPU|nr:uncharacterized protein LOC100888466 [Strongylocentrotus purpuratus]